MNEKYQQTVRLAQALAVHCIPNDQQNAEELALDLVTYIEAWEPRGNS